MINKILTTVMITTALVATSASANACSKLKSQTKSKLSQCKSIGKGKAGYGNCVKQYRKLKSKYSAGCSGGGKSITEQLKTWEDVLSDCKARNKMKSGRCATAVKNLGALWQKEESRLYVECEDKFDTKYQRWVDRDKRGAEPKKCANKSVKAIGYFEQFLQNYKGNKSYPGVLMQASFVYLKQLNEAKSLPLWKELVNDYPNHSLAPSAWLRIGEYYYNERKNSEAIAAYKNVVNSPTLKGKNGALALYHMAEAQNNIGYFEESAETFYKYISGADAGKYPSDLRVEALSYMAGCFADMDEGINVAVEFMDRKKNVTYKDTIFFEIGMKNYKRDRLEEAAFSFNRLLEINPTYVDAPEAHVKLLQILDEKKKEDEAHEQRQKVVKLYGPGTDWYRSNSNNKVALENGKKTIRAAYFKIPAYYHVKADKLDKEGNTDGAQVEYAQALKNYKIFMQTYSEASWENYAVLYYISNVQSSLGKFNEQAATLNQMVAADTTKFGRKTPGYPQEVLVQKDAAYNAVLATEKNREQGLKSVGGDEEKAYNLASTKMYLSQVETYLATFGKDPKNEDAALIAYNAAIVHYNAKQYKTSVRVLQQLKSVYPTHKYIKEIRLSLANSFVFAEMLKEGEAEYESLLKLYVAKDSMYPVIEQSIAAVQFQQAEKQFKGKQFELAAKSYVAIQKRFPRAEFADQALFRAGESYEGLNKSDKAVKVLLSISELYPKSKFKISSIYRSGKIYKEAGKSVKAAETFLLITKRFPKDSAAFTAIGVAASTYDSIPDKKTAAETFKLAHLKYPGHSETPAYVYNACLLYEEIKMVEEAIACNKLIVSDYAKSSYALDAAWSIGVAYEKGERWAEAAVAYLKFIKKFPEANLKAIAAHFQAAKAYRKLDKTKEANEQFALTLETYDRHGLALDADPSVPSEAAFRLGEFERGQLDAIILSGNDKAKEKQMKGLVAFLTKATEYFSTSAGYASEKWTFKATNEIAGLFVTAARIIREQEIIGEAEVKFAGMIGVVQQLPSWYDKATPLFEKNIQIAREQGYHNEEVVSAENGYIEMFYQNGAVFEELGRAFGEAPTPDLSSVGVEDIKYELEDMGYVSEDYGTDPKGFLNDIYKGELLEKGDQAAAGAMPKYASCLKASKHYGIKNDWTTKCQERLSVLDPENEALKLAWEKFDVSSLFQDKEFFATRNRIEKIFASTVMPAVEKLEALKKIAEENSAKAPALESELAALKAKLAPAPGTVPAAQ